MKPLRLELTYFRQYKKETIYFPEEGLIGILGSNGAGKSTLFNAMGWNLYGKIKGVTSSMIKNQAAGKKDPCCVVFDFLFQNQHYRVCRDTVSSRCYVQVDGVIRAVGTTSVNAFIEQDVFRMDYNAFCTCYYAEQDDFDALVKLNAGPRVATLSKLLRIETIDQAAEKVRKEYRELELEVEESKKYIKNEAALFEAKQIKEQLIASSSTQLAQLVTDIEQNTSMHRTLLEKKEVEENTHRLYRQYKNEQQQHSVQIQTLTQHSLDPAKARLAKLMTIKEKYDAMVHHKETYKQLQEEEKHLSNARVDYREKCTVQQEMDSIKQEVMAYAKEIEQLTQSLIPFNQLEQDIATEEATIQSLQEAIDQLTENIQAITYEGKAKKTRYQTLRQEKEDFLHLEVGIPCPTCKQALGKEHVEEELQKNEQEMNALATEMKQLQAQAVTLDTERKAKKEAILQGQNRLGTLRNDLVQKNKTSERLHVLNSEIAKRKETYQALTTRFQRVKDVAFDEARFTQLSSELEQQAKIYESLMKSEEMIQEIPLLTDQIQEILQTIQMHEKHIQALQITIDALKFDEEAYQAIQTSIEENQQILSVKKEEKAKIETTIQVTRTEIASIDEKLEENRVISAAIKQKEKTMVLLAKLDEVYKGYKTDKLKKLAPALSTIMSNYMDTMTDGKYDQIELDDKYNISIYRNGVHNPLEFYSGGEKKLAALCQRLAISELVVSQTGQANFDMLAMDEVLGAMDNDRQDSIIDMLRNLNAIFPQILIVAHNEHAKELFDYVLEIKQDKDGFSTATWSTPWDDSAVKAYIATYDEQIDEG